MSDLFMDVAPKSTTLVVIDDVADLRRLYRLAFAASPLRVVGEAADGRDGLAQVLEKKPHLVLLDLSMPHMDGLEALLAIRRQAPDSRVVVVSGFTRERLEATVRTLGASDYIEKGVRPSELVDRLLAAAHRPPEPFVEPRPRDIEQLRARLNELI